MRSPWPPLVFLLLGIAGGVAIFLSYTSDAAHWATSQNAEVWAPTYQVAPPSAGLVTSWDTRSPGSYVATGARLGAVQGQTGETALRAPHSGTLVSAFGYRGALVQSGQELALLAELGRPYVIAYVGESDAGKLAPGQQVDVTFASNPGKTVQGSVARVYPAVAEITWPLPAIATSSSFSKQVQWVPVRIDFPQGAAVPRYLGMSATVRIAIGGGGS